MTRWGWAAMMVLACAACGGDDGPPVGPDAATPRDAGRDAAVRDAPADAARECEVDGDCDDAVYCNGTELCSGGACAPGSPPPCDDTNPCTADRCDEATSACVHGGPDGDGDGHIAVGCGDGDDCDDADAERHPGNPEVCDPAHDEDCDPDTFGERDEDGDGWFDDRCCNVLESSAPTCGDDCDDGSSDVHPTEAESCNTIDDDCDGLTDEGVGTSWYPDEDGDDFGSSTGTPVVACTRPPRYAMTATDCDDLHAGVNPGLGESCDALGDNDCAPGNPFDDDDDGFDDAGDCTTGPDCDDDDAAVHPGAAELCDGRDGDCSSGGGAARGEDFDGDRHSPPAGCSGGPYPTDDCNDGDPGVHGGAPEICDAIDDDCDLAVDEEPAATMGCSPPGTDGECRMGTCTILACLGTYLNCDSDPGNGCEADSSSDPRHCSGCGRRCATGGTCTSGVCGCPAAAPATCGGACVDTTTDESHCGSCGRACPGGGTCTGGGCICPMGYATCGSECVDTLTDNRHCGGCGRSCSGGSCAGGVCRCPVGFTLCSGACRDTRDDELSCGACDRRCLDGADCGAGLCHPAAGPVITWADAGSDIGGDVATDAAGNVYVTGSFRGTLRFGATTIAGRGGSDGFVASFSPAGVVRWARGIRSTADDVANEHEPAVVVDGAGRVYVTGTTRGTTVDFGGGDVIATEPGPYLARYDAATGALASVTRWTGEITFPDLAVDGMDRVYLTGQLLGTTDLGSGHGPCVEYCTLVARFDPGGAHRWSSSFVGMPIFGGFANGGRGIAASSTTVWVAGYFLGRVDFGGGELRSMDVADAYLLRLAPADGGHLGSAAYGGPLQQVAYGVALDGAGNAYVTGDLDGTASFGGAVLDDAGSGPDTNDVVVASYRPDGSHRWSVLLGTAGNEQGRGVAMAGSSLMVAGWLDSPVTLGTSMLEPELQDAFVAALDPASGAVDWAVALGGASTDRGYSVAGAASGAWITGRVSGTVDLGAGPVGAGGDDGFLVHVTP